MTGWRRAAQKKNLIVGGFVSVIFLMALVFYVALQGFQRVESYHRQHAVLEQKTRIVYQMREAIQKRSFSLSHLANLSDFFDRDEERQKFNGYARDFIMARTRLLELGNTEEEMQLLGRVTETIAEVQPVFERTVEYIVENGPGGDSATKLMNDGYTEQVRVLSLLDTLVETQEALRHQSQLKIAGEKARIIPALSFATAIILFVSALIAVVVVRREGKLIKELVHARKVADEANTAKSLFLANMSHELRTPLNAIIGFSDSLISGVFGKIQDARHTEYIEMINRSGSLLLSLVNDILDLSAVEIGKVKLNYETINAKALIKECVELVLPRAKERDMSVDIDVDGDGPSLMGDARRLRQVLLNLGTNAVKFTPDGGRVCFAVRVDEASGNVLFTVSDTGIGMSEAEIRKALISFEQVHRGKLGKHEGAGLGLPLSKRLVELHGGALTLDSRSGVGTTVLVELPVRPSSMPEGEEE